MAPRSAAGPAGTAANDPKRTSHQYISRPQHGPTLPPALARESLFECRGPDCRADLLCETEALAVLPGTSVLAGACGYVTCSRHLLNGAHRIVAQEACARAGLDQVAGGFSAGAFGSSSPRPSCFVSRLSCRHSGRVASSPALHSAIASRPSSRLPRRSPRRSMPPVCAYAVVITNPAVASTVTADSNNCLCFTLNLSR